MPEDLRPDLLLVKSPAAEHLTTQCIRSLLQVCSTRPGLIGRSTAIRAIPVSPSVVVDN